MKDLGKAAYLLVMEIRRQPEGGILLLLEKYTKEILFKFAAGSCRVTGTPLPPYSKLSSADSPQTLEARALMVDVPYRSAIGSLMYLTVSQDQTSWQQSAVSPDSMQILAKHIGKLCSTSCDICKEMLGKAFATRQGHRPKSGDTMTPLT